MKQAIGLTAISRIPFLFGPVFGWVLWGDEDVDEERGCEREVEEGLDRRASTGARDFGVFEADGERMPLLIKIDPPPEERTEQSGSYC